MTNQPHSAADPQPGPAPAPRRKRRWPWIVAGLVAVIAIGSAMGGGGSDPSPPTDANTAAPAGQLAEKPAEKAAEVKPKTVTVVYEVSGTGTSNGITYSTDGGASMAQDKGKLPWTKRVEWPADKALLVASLTAQSGSGSASAEITCRITVNGKEIKTATSKGAYTVAMCSESVGTLSR